MVLYIVEKVTEYLLTKSEALDPVKVITTMDATF